MAGKSKKRVGIFSFTCDEGCSVYLIEIFNKKLLKWLEKIELAYFLTIRDKTEIKDFDISLVEGVISTEHEKKEIEKIRKNSKILIALGTCAISGQPGGQRNTFNESQKEEIKDELKQYDYLPKCLSLKEVVRVDDEIMGCPINEDKLIEVFEKYINQ